MIFRNILLISALLLAGCFSPYQKQEKAVVVFSDGGTKVDELTNEEIDENLKLAATNSLMGEGLGSHIFSLVEHDDIKNYHQISQYALENNGDNESKSFSSGSMEGSITPVKTFRGLDGGFCREYKQNIRIGKFYKEASNNACRKSDGSWSVLE